VEEGSNLFVFPHVVEDEQSTGTLLKEPAQMSTGQVGIVEFGGVAGDEPGDFGNLGGHSGSSADVPADGDGIDPGTEPAPHPPAGAHGRGQGGLAEPARPHK
jgi:hypothetical protein